CARGSTTVVATEGWYFDVW
nr:immunoglobulin heavy chain junction region [Mus musculus]